MAHIIVDSTCDLSLEELEQLKVEMLSLKVNFGMETYEDKRTITNEQFYEKLAASEALPTTSLLSVGDFLEAFEKHPNESIVVITISSKLSGTYQSAIMAKTELDRDDIYVVDSTTVTLALGMLVKLAAKLRDEGKSGQEIAETVTYYSSKVRILAVLDTLKYLVKGGRLSAAQGVIGSMLSVKPIISVTDGVVNNVGKVRGMNAALKSLVEILQEKENVDWDMPVGFVHSGNLTLLNTFAEMLDYKDTQDIWYLGSVVGTHVGPGAVGITYFVE